MYASQPTHLFAQVVRQATPEEIKTANEANNGSSMPLFIGVVCFVVVALGVFALLRRRR